MEEIADVLQRAVQGVRISHVAFDDLAGEGCNIGPRARRTHERADGVAAFRKNARNRGPDKARSTRNQYAVAIRHSRPVQLWRNSSSNLSGARARCPSTACQTSKVG